MSQFLLACIEEAKRAGIYSDDLPRVICSDMPASITILDTDAIPLPQDCHAYDGQKDLQDIDAKPIPKTDDADVPPLPVVTPKCQLATCKHTEQCELAEEVTNLHKQLKLSAATISQHVSEVARMKRNHRYDLRLLQKTVLSAPAKDMKAMNDLNQRFIKLSTERDMLAAKEIQLEEQSLALKHYVISLVNERNELIRKLDNDFPLGSQSSRGPIGDVIVLSVNHVSKLSIQSYKFQCHGSANEEQILVDLRQ